LGNLVRFKLLPGQRSEITGVPELVDGLTFEALLADKAFDVNHLRQDLAERDAAAIIPAKCNRKVHIPHDQEMYKWRHLVENYFSKIKEFRGVNTRYDKTDTSYEATWHIAATIIELR
ncbi:MAG: transposase, partial [Kordiimonadaceae bacterium]|nr:transposase [Kordiimonadaceae bacterium]